MVIRMTREKYLKKLIKQRGLNIKDFAAIIDVPASTLYSLLSDNKIGRASIDNVIKVCRGLGITVEELQQVEEQNVKASEEPLILSDLEKRLIAHYRQYKNRQDAINILAFAEDPEYNKDL